MNSFERIGALTDIHFGRKSDSEVHNRDCLEYLAWFKDQAIERKVDRIVCMGDWYDNRSRLRLDTMWSSRKGIDILNSIGVPIWWIVGNHDMYFRYNRDIHSHPFLDLYENVTVINEIQNLGDVLLCPYLVGTEYADPPAYECKYVFGHFEFPTFLTNEWYEYEDKGVGLHADMFTYPEWVFSGHFHKRQIKENIHGVKICYIGNVFPMDYNDVNDRERGAMFLDYDGDPEFVNWTDAPNYNRVFMSDILEYIDGDTFGDKFNKKSVIECTDDLDLPYEDIQTVRESLQDQVRSITVKPKPKTEVDQEVEIEMKGNMDQIVLEAIENVQVKGTRINTGILTSLYNEVREE